MLFADKAAAHEGIGIVGVKSNDEIQTAGQLCGVPRNLVVMALGAWVVIVPLCSVGGT